MNYQSAIEKAYNDKINEFHFYVNEIGIEKAREIILESTCNKKVRTYINNYKGDKL